MVKKELINRFDLTALQDSFSESAMAAACPKESTINTPGITGCPGK